MRALYAALAFVATLALGCEQLAQSLVTDAGEPPPASDGGAASEPTVVGGGCGVDRTSGAELCAATSRCPDVVVDVDAMPGCGFRIRGSVVDLVCACGTAICPVGLFGTCAEAKELLTNQTQQGVCVQLTEGRCLDPSSTTGSSSSGGGGENPACDQQCVKDCGGGAACASVCNCD